MGKWIILVQCDEFQRKGYWSWPIQCQVRGHHLSKDAPDNSVRTDGVSGNCIQHSIIQVSNAATPHGIEANHTGARGIWVEPEVSHRTGEDPRSYRYCIRGSGVSFSASTHKRLLGNGVTSWCPNGCLRLNFCTCANDKPMFHTPRDDMKDKDIELLPSTVLDNLDIEEILSLLGPGRHGLGSGTVSTSDYPGSLLQKSEQPMHVVSNLNFVIQYNMFSTWSKVHLLWMFFLIFI